MENGGGNSKYIKWVSPPLVALTEAVGIAENRTREPANR